MEDPQVYDEDDYRPAMSGEPMEPENNAIVATPERNNTANGSNSPMDPLEEAEAAAAAAEVALLDGNFNNTNNRGRDSNADRALMGTDAGDDGIRAHEATDESGELVRGAFEEFLQN